MVLQGRYLNLLDINGIQTSKFEKETFRMKAVKPFIEIVNSFGKETLSLLKRHTLEMPRTLIGYL